MNRITFWAMMGNSYKSKPKPNDSCEEKINRKILLWQENSVYYNQ